MGRHWYRLSRALCVTSLAAVGVVTVVTPGPTTAAPAETARVANPIIKERFVADPSAHVFNNRMYIYATDDQTNSGTYWDSKVWRAYSSTDLRSWTNHGSFFGIARGFAWANQYAWAPTAAYRNGFYYFYAPVDRTKIGVARSTSPTGEFRDVRGTPLIDKARDPNTGAEPIDPAVFTDDDGQAYLYFGTRTPKVVKLGADMMSTVGGIQDVSISTANYGEAPWLHKRNGIYYLSYSTGWPGQIVYATGTSPLGPFTYRGVILDYTNISTNHQSIVEYQNRWYIVYHKNASPGGGSFKRSLAMEYLHHNTDGTIVRVPQTTTGVDPVDPRGYLTLTARHSGKVVEVPGRSTSDGTTLGQYPRRKSGTPQHWQLRDAGDGYVNLVNRNSGKCMAVNVASPDEDDPIVQWSCGSDPAQQWQLREADGGYLQLVARHSGKCLAVGTGSTDDGAVLTERTCGSAPSQHWQRSAA